MIRIIYALSLMLLLTPNIMAEEKIVFSFTCKILDQQILGVMDGKSSRYSGYTDGSKVGDTFKLDFEYSGFGMFGYVLEIKTDGTEVRLNTRTSDQEFPESDYTGESPIFESYGNLHQLSENDLNIERLDNQITGRRYYKNDWNLVLRSGLFDEIFLQTANCMNVLSELGVMLETIKAFHK